MALQKRRLGKGRIHHRRSAWMRRQTEAAATQLGTCSNCGTKKITHHVCDECGFYGGRQVVEVSQEGFEE